MSKITDATEAIEKGADDFDATTDAIDAEEMLSVLRAFAKKLRETAAGLDDKSIHPAHAANRLRKMARGIDGGK